MIGLANSANSRLGKILRPLKDWIKYTLYKIRCQALCLLTTVEKYAILVCWPWKSALTIQILAKSSEIAHKNKEGREKSAK